MGPAERRAFIALRTKVYTKRSNLAQNSACCFRFRVVQASQAAEEVLPPFCHSERSEESLFLFLNLIRREIPRSAQNENMKARLLPSAIRCRWETFKERSRAWLSISRLILISGTPGWTGKTTRGKPAGAIGWSMLRERCESI